MAKFKSLQELSDYLNKGGKVRSLNNNSGVSRGGIITCQKDACYVNGSYVYAVLANGQVYSWTLASVEKVMETKIDLEETVRQLTQEIQTIESKLKYLSETKQDTFDETEFKVWNTLQVLKGKKNDIEKAKVIAQLINS